MNKFFKQSEFACKCGCGSKSIDERLVWVATCARLHFNQPVTITSAHRCPTHNKNVGGASKSQHLGGNAIDIQVKGVTPKEVQKFFDDLFDSRYGIGYGRNFTHIDMRSNPARFNY